MNEPGIFISDAEFEHLMNMRKRTKFNPTREEIAQATIDFLCKGGKITKVYPADRTCEELNRMAGESFTND